MLVNISAPQSGSITPEGFGFSSPISRILSESGKSSGGGYYKASESDIVTDVMEGITKGRGGAATVLEDAAAGGVVADVALVFDDNDDKKVKGIFTETDYIKVSSTCTK